MNLFQRFTQLLAAASAGIVAVLAFGTLLNVLGRALFATPIPGVVDLAALCMVLCVFLGLGQAEFTEAHVRMEVFSSRLCARARQRVQVVAMLVSTAFLSFMAHGAYLRAVRAYKANEEVPGMIPLYLWPFRFVIVFGVAIMAAVCLVKAWRYVTDRE